MSIYAARGATSNIHVRHACHSQSKRNVAARGSGEKNRCARLSTRVYNIQGESDEKFLFLQNDQRWEKIHSIHQNCKTSRGTIKLIIFIIIGLILIILYYFNYISLIILFSVRNLMIFYLIFEVSLILTFTIIIYWGYNFERLRASFYLLIYIIFISLLLLAYIIKLFKFLKWSY